MKSNKSKYAFKVPDKEIVYEDLRAIGIEPTEVGYWPYIEDLWIHKCSPKQSYYIGTTFHQQDIVAYKRGLVTDTIPKWPKQPSWVLLARESVSFGMAPPVRKKEKFSEEDIEIKDKWSYMDHHAKKEDPYSDKITPKKFNLDVYRDKIVRKKKGNLGGSFSLPHVTVYGEDDKLGKSTNRTVDLLKKYGHFRKVKGEEDIEYLKKHQYAHKKDQDFEEYIEKHLPCAECAPEVFTMLELLFYHYSEKFKYYGNLDKLGEIIVDYYVRGKKCYKKEGKFLKKWKDIWNEVQ